MRILVIGFLFFTLQSTSTEAQSTTTATAFNSPRLISFKREAEKAIGKPLSQTNLVRRSLHPILEEIKVEKTGFHAMRRFRTTWLRKQRAPEDLNQFWLGHAEQSVTDGYSKLAEDVEFRAQVAETVGTGFAVPASVRPMRPRKRKEEVAKVAA